MGRGILLWLLGVPIPAKRSASSRKSGPADGGAFFAARRRCNSDAARFFVKIPI